VAAALMIPLATDCTASPSPPTATGAAKRIGSAIAGLIRPIDELIDLAVEQIILAAAPESPGRTRWRRRGRRPRSSGRISPVGGSGRRPRCDDDDRRGADIHDPPGA
jgi:hypothetical protein